MRGYRKPFSEKLLQPFKGCGSFYRLDKINKLNN